jgi:formate dehydrogenase subunit beta
MTPDTRVETGAVGQTEKEIRKIAARLLEEGKVDAVIGYRQGSLPHITQAVMARTPDQAAELVFNRHCRLNLAAYLTPERLGKGRVAVVAKGCDSRNMVIQIQENRYPREDIYVIGVPCTGMLDKTALATGELQSNCTTCISRNPVIHDEMAAAAVPELETNPEGGRFADVEEIEAMPPREKAAFFAELISACTRCYACRNACPLCYCPTCFVDGARPQWVGKTIDPTDVMTYHLVRAFHDAGRCTDCGACEAACPMGIPVRRFTRKTIRDTVAAFGCESGMDLNLRPPLDRFELKDPEDFIR